MPSASSPAVRQNRAPGGELCPSRSRRRGDAKRPRIPVTAMVQAASLELAGWSGESDPAQGVARALPLPRRHGP